MDGLAGDLDSVLRRAAESGVDRVGQVFLGPGAYRRNKAMFDGRPEVYFILGVHPHDASGLDETGLAALREAFQSDPRIRALGETGLDYFYDNSPRQAQRAAFRAQLALARELDKPVVIHSRDADEDSMAILAEEGFDERPLLWHCFGRDAEFAAGLLRRGWHVSIPGTVTYRKAEGLRRAVAEIPLERMLVETDCPFLAPEPYRGKTNEPALAAFTAARIAEIKGLSVEEVWERTGDNARRFFGLDQA
jgi:TatD DNase family protein